MRQINVFIVSLLFVFLPLIHGAAEEPNTDAPGFNIGTYRDYLKLNKPLTFNEGVDFARNYLSIRELNHKNLTFGVYETDGYVVKIYSCPPCPEQSYCKPCQVEHVVISGNPSELSNYNDMTDNEVVVFTHDNSHFNLGQKYRFIFKVLNSKTVNQLSNNLQLIYSKEAK